MAQKAKRKNKFFVSGTPDYALIIITIILLLTGLIMLLSASAPASLSENGNSHDIFVKQAKFVGVGIVFMFAASKINYRKFSSRTWQIIFYIVSIFFAVSVLVFGISSGGAKRWIKIPGVPSFQPSEMIKVLMILFFAAYLPTLKDSVQKVEGFWKKYLVGFLLPVGLLGFILVLIFKLQNHASVCILIALIVLVQMFVSGMKIRQFMITGLVAVVVLAGCYGVYTLITNSSKENIATTEDESGFNFRSERIKIWLDPDSNLTGTGWQINQSFYAIGSGGLFGVGLGKSNQKNLYIPEPHNDFIFAVIAEELGFVGSVSIIILFLLFIWRGLIIAMNATDMMGTLIAIGVTALIGLEALINVAVVTGTIPVTGMPLPFFSYGGTALIINLIAVGLLLSVSRGENNN